jgi:hypothetical protein
MTHGLGRIYVHDPADWSSTKLHALLDEHATVIPPSALWDDPAVLDQGNFGTCVGNGWAGWGDSAPVLDLFTETDARAIYYEATVIDGSPDDPDKPGGGQQGSTVRSGAKAMQNRGKLTAYAFTTTLPTIREWLANHGPVVMGTDWTNDMFTPKAGWVTPTGGVAGGHCYLCIGYDTTNDSFRFRNSWGSSWGIMGDFGMKSADLAKLLVGIESPGEACMSAEVPAPAPGPFPDTTLANALRVWAYARHSGSNRAAALAVQAWLRAKGIV